MNILDILDEEDKKTITPDVASRLESVFCTELAKQLDKSEKKNKETFDNFVESVNKKFDEKISNAILENVKTQKSNIMGDKLYKVVSDIANVLESAGIPTTETTKRLKEELAQSNVELQKVYQARELIKQKLNEEEKINFIYAETKGLKPELIDAVIEYFKDKDIREIDRPAIEKFISGDHSDVFLQDIDMDADTDLNMDKVNAALKDIEYNLNIATPTITRSNKGNTKFESLGHGLDKQRVFNSPNVTQDDLDDSQNDQDDDIQDAINNCNAFNDISFGQNSFI
jgi:hypothetical protein